MLVSDDERRNRIRTERSRGGGRETRVLCGADHRASCSSSHFERVDQGGHSKESRRHFEFQRELLQGESRESEEATKTVVLIKRGGIQWLPFFK